MWLIMISNHITGARSTAAVSFETGIGQTNFAGPEQICLNKSCKSCVTF